MINLALNVFMLSEEQEDRLEEGEQIKFEDCLIVEHVFYRIDYIRPFSGGKYSQINSGGDLFIVDEPFYQIKAKMQELSTFLFN